MQAQYTIRCRSISREAVKDSLHALGIPTAVYYPVPVHLQPAFTRFGFIEGSCPVAERCARQVLSLPMHTFLTNEEQDAVVKAIGKVLLLPGRTPSSALASRMKIGVIGAGYWGRNHVRTLARLGMLGAVCDISAELRVVMAQLYPEARTFATVDELLASRSCSAVCIATPPAKHAAIAMQCLQAGYDVLIEKPVCLSSKELEEVLAVAQQHNRLVFGGHLLRYHSGFVALHDMVRSGALGAIHYVEATRKSLGRQYPDASVLWDYGPHDVSLILALFNDKMPCDVSAEHGGTAGKPSDFLTAHLTFGSGRASIHLNRVFPGKELKLVVVGSLGSAILDDMKQGDERLVVYPPVEGGLELGSVFDYLSRGRQVRVDELLPLDRELLAFEACVRTRDEPATGAAELRRVTQVLELMDSSARARKPSHNSAAGGFGDVLL